VSIDSVQVSADGNLLRAVPVGMSRPDLAEAFPDLPRAGTAGFHMWLDLSALPLDGETKLEVSAALTAGETVILGVVDISPIG
jgi:hypothetical protein